MDLLKQFQDNWFQKNWGSPGQAILLAVSGGVDSMVMCDLFLHSSIPFEIAHCNFQLRGHDAELDEQLVAQWAAGNKVRLHVNRFDTLNAAAEWKMGIQETARKLRYDWFEILRRENKYAAIATAHHADDNAETLLINLFKGTGLKGLQGIPEYNNHIVRPLLFSPKAFIAAYAAQQQIPYRDDASNASDKYLRNAVRNNLLPAIEQYFPAVKDRLNEDIDRFRKSAAFYTDAMDKEISGLVEDRGADKYIPVLKLLKLKHIEAICYELFSAYGLTGNQLPQLMQLLQAATGKWMETATHRIIRNRDFLIVTEQQTSKTDFIVIDSLPDAVETNNGIFRLEIIDSAIVETTAATAMIDMARIEMPLVLRRWKTGDYFYPLGMGMKKKKLSRYFIDQKIPVHEKQHVWVLESARKIVWVCGFRLDERFKVKPSTSSILKITIS